MKSNETIEAYRIEKLANGKTQKVLAGTTTWNRPETVQEILDEFDEAEIVASFVSGFVVREQAKLRAKTTKDPMTEAQKWFAKLSPEQQKSMLEKNGVGDTDEQTNRNYHEAELMEK